MYPFLSHFLDIDLKYLEAAIYRLFRTQKQPSGYFS